MSLVWRRVVGRNGTELWFESEPERLGGYEPDGGRFRVYDDRGHYRTTVATEQEAIDAIVTQAEAAFARPPEDKLRARIEELEDRIEEL